MKTLMVHFGKLHPTRAACVAALRGWYPEAEHIWIDDNNYPSAVWQMNQYLGIKREWPIDTLISRVVLADRLRFWICATMENVVALDTDTLILDRLEFDPNKTYLGEVCSGEGDMCYMFNGHNLTEFERILRMSIEERFIGQSVAGLAVEIPHRLISFDTFIHFGSKQFSRVIAHGERHWWEL